MWGGWYLGVGLGVEVAVGAVGGEVQVGGVLGAQLDRGIVGEHFECYGNCDKETLS